MHWKTHSGIVAAALSLIGVSPAWGQSEINVLICSTGDRSSGKNAAVVHGYTWVQYQTESLFLQRLQQDDWDLVILEMPRDIFTQKEKIAQLLEHHMANGGRMLVTFNNLDEWPRLQKLLGLDAAIERPTPEDVFQLSPPHPSYPYHPSGWNNPWLTDPWPDRGDYLVPDENSLVAAEFESKNAAVVIGNNEHTIVNGFGWDGYSGGASDSLAVHQVEYLMRCPADFDSSTGIGTLDILDFLEFQRLFVEQDYRANMMFDANLDIFDFLAFQNAFVNGCE